MIAHVVGARPNFMKAAPVHAAVAASGRLAQCVVHTGQHYSASLNEVVYADLGLPRPDHHLGAGSGTHAEQTARIMVAFEQLLAEVRLDAVVVYGDVNSTVACALVAAKAGVPVAHVEAGLRSFDPAMPEEINRIVTDRLAGRLYVHSPEAIDHLRREGADPTSIVPVGNTMIDTLDRHLPRALARRPWEAFGAPEGGYVLVTLHRPAMVDDPDLLERAMRALAELSEWRPVVFPVHPRTRGRLEGLDAAAAPALHLVEPVGYLDFLGLEAGALACLTDSGGIQEEAACLGVPCFTLRANTERPVTLSAGNHLLGLDPEAIASVPELLAQTPRGWARPNGWDGHAGERVAADLEAWLGSLDSPPAPRHGVDVMLSAQGRLL